MRAINIYFSGNLFILQVHVCIQKERVNVSINPSCKHNFIKVDFDNAPVFKDMNITMDKYVFYSNFHVIYMDNVDIFLGYTWIRSMGTINCIEEFFLKLWYKKKKATLQDISLTTK